MSLTVTEAHAVNVLLRWVTQRDHGHIAVPSTDEALTAAQTLAQKAYDRLSAGWRPDELPAVWPHGMERRSPARGGRVLMSGREDVVRRAASLEALTNRLTWALDDHPDTGAVDEHGQCEKVQDVGREVVTWLRKDLEDLTERIKADG